MLVQTYANTPVTTAWKQGSAVKGNKLLRKVTAIATFENGKYPNNASGNHAALYISQDAIAIYVMDQWADDKAKPTISKRPIRFKGENATSSPSNNGDAYFVIE